MRTGVKTLYLILWDGHEDSDRGRECRTISVDMNVGASNLIRVCDIVVERDWLALVPAKAQRLGRNCQKLVACLRTIYPDGTVRSEEINLSHLIFE